MDYYARFKNDIKDHEGNIIFKQNDNTKITRYAIIDEDENGYFIAGNPNDIDCRKVNYFSAGCEYEIFDIKEEC